MKGFFAQSYANNFTPWEVAGDAGQQQIRRLLDRELAEHGAPPGRALDVGCGRGRHAAALAADGWRVTGIDYIPEAIEQAVSRPGTDAVEFVVGDATDLTSQVSGTFDFVLDVGCFHGFDSGERDAFGRGLSALTKPDCTMLMLAFEPGAPPPLPAGIVKADIDAALPGWELIDQETVDTAGLPIPQVRTHWYRLRRMW